jgi:MoxR-like ATPase
MPSDILGSEILDESRQFKFIKGQYNFDEINRTPPKTQAALLKQCKSVLLQSLEKTIS